MNLGILHVNNSIHNILVFVLKWKLVSNGSRDEDKDNVNFFDENGWYGWKWMTVDENE